MIIFLYEKGLWEYFQICKYTFFNTIINVIIFSVKRDNGDVWGYE